MPNHLDDNTSHAAAAAAEAALRAADVAARAEQGKASPILFSGAMIRAILDGRKVQTRRVVKPQWPAGAIPKEHSSVPGYWMPYTADRRLMNGFQGSRKDDCGIYCPYQVGQRLWCRETWAPHAVLPGVAWYRADNPLVDGESPVDAWRPSIFMPRWASRITLEVTGVRVERVNEISEEDARAEGIRVYLPPFPFPADWPKNDEDKYTPAYGTEYSSDRSGFATSARDAFRALWDGINSKRGFAFDTGPWVWVVSFRRIEQ